VYSTDGGAAAAHGLGEAVSAVHHGSLQSRL